MNGDPKKKKGRGRYILYNVVVLQQHTSFYSYLQQIQPGLQSKLSIFKQNVSSPRFTYHLIHFYLLVIVTAIIVRRVI